MRRECGFIAVIERHEELPNFVEWLLTIVLSRRSLCARGRPSVQFMAIISFRSGAKVFKIRRRLFQDPGGAVVDAGIRLGIRLPPGISDEPPSQMRRLVNGDLR